jgi:hypothetical protein
MPLDRPAAGTIFAAMNSRYLLALGLVLPLLNACGEGSSRQVQNDEYGDYRRGQVRNRPLGTDAGLVIFGVDKDREARDAAARANGGVSVNAYLWRATLDTLGFMPLTSADPFGGTVITDWYSPPGAQDERFRAQAYVLGRQLRSDGVKVQVFRQVYERGGWKDAAVSAGTNADLEDKVLARARELRSQSGQR